MLLLAGAVFAGSASCRPCHTKIFDNYAKTPMARSSGRVDSVTPAQFSAAGHRYRVENNRLYFDQGNAPIDYFIGSKSAWLGCLFSLRGDLLVVPRSWY